jgi:hypothetical protein
MANIGAGESYVAYLVKRDNVNVVDSLIKNAVASQEIITSAYCKRFKYRFLSSTEMTYQPLSTHLKGKIDGSIFTSETDLNAVERDKLYFVGGIMDGKYLTIMRILPQVQHGAYTVNKKAPKIMELA